MASRQIRTLILCLFAVFAFSAVAVSTASAKRVWTYCEEVAPGKGEFIEHLCKTKVTVKGEAAGKFEDITLPVGVTKKLEVVEVVKPFELIAGTTTITCEAVTLTGGTIENIEAENIEKVKGKTGRDKGTVEFSKCKSSVAGCTVKVPIIDKGKETALVENTTKTKIYDMFTPEGWTEATTKAGAEKIKPFAKIEQTGGEKCLNTEVEGDGVAGEIEPEGLSETKIFKFPCPKLTPVNLWNGVKEVNLRLDAFGLTTAEECGQVKLALASRWGWDVQ